jgi:uncharacterized protein (DUF342 family)
MPADELSQLVRVEIDADGLEATLCVTPGPEPTLVDEATLLALLAERSVKLDQPARQRLDEALHTLRTRPNDPLRVVVARGRPPTHGQDGRLEFAPGLDPHQPPPPEPTGAGEHDGQGATGGPGAPGEPGCSGVLGTGPESVGPQSHYQRRAFQPVKAGQTIAQLFPPTPGEDGVDVHARVIPARPGRPFALTTDESIQLAGDGRVVALRDGLIEHRPPMLRISASLLINGYVDFSTGHVEFAGCVEVLRGVRELFNVSATHSLKVHGLVEACEISAGRDAELLGGMAARGQGGLRVGRDARAKYLDQVRGRIARDLHAENDLVQCQLEIGRRLDAPACSITGGLVVVAGRANVGTLGSESGVATELRLGCIPSIEQAIDALLEIVPPLQARVAKANEALGQLSSVQGKRAHQQAELLTELQFGVSQAQERLRPVLARLEQLRASLAAHAQVDLLVNERIHPGVVIRAGGYEVRFQELCRGPLRITLDAAGRPQATRPGPGGGEAELARLARVRALESPPPGVRAASLSPAAALAA